VPQVDHCLIDLIHVGALLLQDLPPIHREAEPSDEDQHLPLIGDGEREGCTHPLKFIHVGLEVGTLPQTIKFEFHSNLVVN
jgi:hypothetical protein